MEEYTGLANIGDARTIVAAPCTMEQFSQMWGEFSDALKNSIAEDEIDNFVYKACDDWRFDSFTRRVQVLAYDTTDGDFTIYILERSHPVVFKMRMPLRDTMRYVLESPASQWHSPIYQARGIAINSLDTGLRVMYDPNSWYAQYKLGDAWNNQTAPYSIGLRVTPETDLTRALHNQQAAQEQPQQQAQAPQDQAPQQQPQNPQPQDQLAQDAAQQQQQQEQAQPQQTVSQVCKDAISTVVGDQEGGQALSKLLTFQADERRRQATLTFHALGLQAENANEYLQDIGMRDIVDQIAAEIQAHGVHVVNVGVTFEQTIGKKLLRSLMS